MITSKFCFLNFFILGFFLLIFNYGVILCVILMRSVVKKDNKTKIKLMALRVIATNSKFDFPR